MSYIENFPKRPRVSVVMPVYNVEKYVAEAITSVLAQSLTDFELLIIDDGGQDGSMALCRRFDDPRIRIISQTNRGLAGARNTGIMSARGEYVAFLDSDDRWTKEKLALHVIHLDANPHISVSFSASQLIDGDGRPMRVTMDVPKRIVTPRQIIRRNPVGNGSTPVIRARALARIAYAHPNDKTRLCYFDENLRQSEDIDCWLRLAIIGKGKFEGLNAPLTEYRIVASGLSANIAAQLASWETVMANVRTFAPDFVARHYRSARAFQLRYLARRAVSLGDGALAWEYVRRAGAEWPAIYVLELRKSVETFLAALAARVLPAAWFARLAERRLQGVR
jgi:glycosyltransferase involved in cell wall biosynthesis